MTQRRLERAERLSERAARVDAYNSVIVPVLNAFRAVVEAVPDEALRGTISRQFADAVNRLGADYVDQGGEGRE